MNRMQRPIGGERPRGVPHREEIYWYQEVSFWSRKSRRGDLGVGGGVIKDIFQCQLGLPGPQEDLVGGVGGPADLFQCPMRL